jgi:molybdate transport system substrate-binding protein
MTDGKLRSSEVRVRVLSTLAMVDVIQNITDRFRDQTGIRIDPEFAPSGLLMERIRSGESADVAILTQDAVSVLTQEGWLSRGSTNLAVSSVGLALSVGAPTVDISTVNKLRSVLVDAKSVAFSASGASGLFFLKLLTQLGIRDLVNAKAVVIPSGFTASCVVSCHAEIAVQQISELRAVKGIGEIFPFPDDAQCLTTFSAVGFVHAPSPIAASSLIAFLASDYVSGQLACAGLDPVGGITVRA